MNPATIQRHAALGKANEVRALKAALKRMIRGHDAAMGRLMVCEVIASPPAELHSMRVEELLDAIHAIGPRKVFEMTRSARVGLHRQLGEMTPGERERLERVVCP